MLTREEAWERVKAFAKLAAETGQEIHTLQKGTTNVITDVKDGSIGRRSSDGRSNVSRVTRGMVFKVWDALLAHGHTECPANVLYLTPALVAAALDDLVMPVGQGEIALRREQQPSGRPASRTLPPALSPLGEEAIEPNTLIEGATRRVLVNAYERNDAARSACIAEYGTACVACGFDFERAYGSAGAGFIHVHHLVPLSSIGDNYTVDPVRDLRPVCANCHVMIHRRTPPFAIEDIQQFIKDATGRDPP